jgi:hypothetical protein
MTTRRATKWAMLSVVLAGAAAGTVGCRKADDSDQGQIGAAVGEVMASADESIQGGAATTMIPVQPRVPILRVPEQLRAPAWRRALEAVAPRAYAATCVATPFSSCANAVRTRAFDSCTIGAATLDGSVTLTFSRTALCAVITAGDSVTRTADINLTGPYGGTLAVTSPGGGQTLTRTATGFEYSVAGMERVLTGPGGRTLFDVSTRTSSPIVITGSSRADLTLVSGSLEVSHNLAHYKVTLTPDNLRWSGNCTCAVSGTLTGTVSGGKLDGKSASVTITACGEADVTLNGQTESVTLDRCAPL